VGEGGMGIVFKAYQVQLHRTVAVKTLRAGVHASTSARARFTNESLAVARLQHENIVHIFEVGMQGDHPFFTMEYIEGRPLNQLLDGKPVGVRQSAELIETLARAIHYAHRNGVVHRDLKPSNILMAAGDRPKIVDFGVAKRLEQQAGLTQTE